MMQLPEVFAQETPRGGLGSDSLDARWLPGFGKATEAPANFSESYFLVYLSAGGSAGGDFPVPEMESHSYCNDIPPGFNSMS